MIETFHDLCQELEINPLHPSQDDLNKLLQWFNSTISTDLDCQGNVQERFDFYQSLATKFLENFRPHMKTEQLTNGMTPLEFIVDSGFNKYLEALHPSADEVRCLIHGITLLHLAAARGHFHTVEALLTLGVNPLDIGTRGMPILFTTLMLPIAHDAHMIKHKQAIYQLLVNLAPDLLDERNESGDTVLHMMSVNGYNSLIEETLAQTPELASISNYANRYPIHAGILNSQHECVKVLVAVPGVDQLTDAKGRDALHYAAKYGDKQMVNICLHSSIPKDSRDKQLQTPLILASIANNHEALSELIMFGADVNLTDNIQRSALHYAVEASDLEAVKRLMAAPGIDIHLRDENAKTALDLLPLGTSLGEQIHQCLRA